MKNAVVLASAAALVALTFSAGPAAAISEFPPPPPPAPKASGPTPTGGGKSGPSPAGTYLLAATFCAAGSLIVQSAYVGNTQNRELTSREAIYTTGNCFVPFIGGPLFWALANGGNPN